MSDSALVQVQISEGIAQLTMDDGKANALSSAMMNELDAALTRAEAEAKAVVVVGRPGRFCAGFDLKVMMSGPEAAKGLVSQGAELLMRMYEFPLPIVAACTGHAVAGGALVLLSCDTRVGTAGDFKIGLNEVSIGMTVPILAQELARDRLAAPSFTAAVLQSQLYNPTHAAAIGFLDRVEEPEGVLAAATETAGALAKLPKAAYAATKGRMRRKTIDHIRATLSADLTELTGPNS
ncbi:MAG: crotonase/enoyl-CoA hydratase family protein [Myxococcota bacterium]